MNKDRLLDRHDNSDNQLDVAAPGNPKKSGVAAWLGEYTGNYTGGGGDYRIETPEALRRNARESWTREYLGMGDQGERLSHKPRSSRVWDLSAIGGEASSKVRDGTEVSSVVVSALFQENPDERHILSEFGKASQLFVQHEPGKEGVEMQDQDPLRRLLIPVRDALGLSEDFVPNAQLSDNRRFLATRQLLHVCATVMTLDVMRVIPDVWEKWLQHCHPTHEEVQAIRLFDPVQTKGAPDFVLRPAVSLLSLYQDARKFLEARKESAGVPHPHQMTWDAYRPIHRLLGVLYDEDPRRLAAHGLTEDKRENEAEGIDSVFFGAAYLYMLYEALEFRAPGNPPPDGLQWHLAHMPRGSHNQFREETAAYLRDETAMLPYSADERSDRNPLGLREIPPQAHGQKHWCIAVVPVDLTGSPDFMDLRARGVYRLDDPRNANVFDLNHQLGAAVLQALGPEAWYTTR